MVVSTFSNIAHQMAIDCFSALDFSSDASEESERVLKIAALATGTLFVAHKLYGYQRRYGEGFRKRVARVLLKIPPISREYQKKVKEKTAGFSAKFRSDWRHLGEPIRKIPESGLPVRNIADLLKRYDKKEREKVKESQLSGAIYSPILRSDEEGRSLSDEEIILLDRGLQESDHMLARAQGRLFDVASSNARFCNPLHTDEFPAGGFVIYQVCQMVGNMFGARPEEIMGMVTSGGTASIMEAVLMYRKRAEDLGRIKLGEGIVLGSDTIHAAFEKAGQDYHVEVIKIPSNPDGKINLNKLEKKLKKYGKRVICIVGSAPNYTTGTVDPISEMSELALKYKCGMHVDACLGGFVVNFLDELETDFLNSEKFPGVSSLSCDTHKNGLAPKGSSVLLTKSLPDEGNLIRYGVRTVPGWDGGRYATLGLEGSRSIVPAFHAFTAMISTGKNGYQRIARGIHDKVKELEACLTQNGFEIIGTPECNVVAFKVNKKFKRGSTHEFANQMKKRGFTLSKLSNDRVHFCVTHRFLVDSDAIDNFEVALQESMQKVISLNDEGAIKTSGDEGAYFDIGDMYKPEISSSSSFGKFMENWMLGSAAAKEGLTRYFTAQSNPYLDKE